MEAELAKIHVPLLYTRIFAIGHLLLSISNLTTYKGKILRLSSRMVLHFVASRTFMYARAPREISSSYSQNFPPFYGGGKFKRWRPNWQKFMHLFCTPGFGNLVCLHTGTFILCGAGLGTMLVGTCSRC